MGRKLVCFTLSALLSLVSFSSALAAEKLKVASGVKLEPLLTMPLIAAEDKGFWKQNGLEAEWVPMEGGAAAMRALAAAAVPLVITGTSGYIRAAAGGLPAIIVADMQIVDYGMRIYVKGDSPLKAPRDLKGARIGVTTLGALAHSYGLLAVKALGLEKDVKFVAVGGIPQTIAGLKAGHVEGIVTTVGSVIPLIVKGEAREVLSMADYLPRKWSEITAIAHKKYARENPDTMKKAVRTLVQSTDFILKNREWTVEKLKTFFGFPAEAAWFYERFNYGKDGKVDPEAIKNVQQFLVDYGIMAKDKALPVPELYTNEFTS